MKLRLPQLGFYRPILGLAILLAGVLYFLTQKLGMVPGLGGGPGAAVNSGASPAAVAASSAAPPIAEAKPLEITIDDHTYFVNNKPVESIDGLVKMSLAVPKEVSPRVRIVRRPSSLYSAETKLGAALEAAKIDFIWAN
jgi:hypothetical protein